MSVFDLSFVDKKSLSNLDAFSSLELALLPWASSIRDVKLKPQTLLRIELLWRRRRASHFENLKRFGVKPKEVLGGRLHTESLNFSVADLSRLPTKQLVLIRFHPSLASKGAGEKRRLLDLAECEYLARREQGGQQTNAKRAAKEELQPTAQDTKRETKRAKNQRKRQRRAARRLAESKAAKEKQSRMSWTPPTARQMHDALKPRNAAAPPQQANAFPFTFSCVKQESV